MFAPDAVALRIRIVFPLYLKSFNCRQLAKHNHHQNNLKTHFHQHQHEWMSYFHRPPEPSAREKDVERFFKGYGRIRDIDLKRGFGFVEFDDPRDAEDAVYELDGKELCNERVTIEHARVRLRGGRGRGGGGGGGRFSDRYGRGSQNSRSRNPPPMRTENRLIVENLSSRVSWQLTPAGHVSARSTLEALVAPSLTCNAWCVVESEREETESWQRERRGKSESRW
ncbi:hypothetical protein INR49_026282 [Caranx melampygus]|nr:hypothetical protein INR49_026282 [Caranx melampygus]